MTQPLVDEIEQLQDCRTSADFAKWLLACPLSKLNKYEFTIRNRLQLRGMGFGIFYMDAMVKMLRLPRNDLAYGLILTEAESATILLEEIAAQKDDDESRPDFDPQVTEL